MNKELIIVGAAALTLATACSNIDETDFSADILYENQKESVDYSKAYKLLESYNLSHREIINFIYLSGKTYYSDINDINYLESTETALAKAREMEMSPKTVFGKPEIQSNVDLPEGIINTIKKVIKNTFSGSEDSQLDNFEIYKNSLGRYYIDYMGSPIRIDDNLNKLLTNHFEPLHQDPSEWKLLDNKNKVRGFVDTLSHDVRIITEKKD